MRSPGEKQLSHGVLLFLCQAVPFALLFLLLQRHWRSSGGLFVSNPWRLLYLPALSLPPLSLRLPGGRHPSWWPWLGWPGGGSEWSQRLVRTEGGWHPPVGLALTAPVQDFAQWVFGLDGNPRPGAWVHRSRW